MKDETFVPSTKQLVDELNILTRLQSERRAVTSRMALASEHLKGIDAQIRMLKYWCPDENGFPQCFLFPRQATWENSYRKPDREVCSSCGCGSNDARKVAPRSPEP